MVKHEIAADEPARHHAAHVKVSVPELPHSLRTRSVATSTALRHRRSCLESSTTSTRVTSCSAFVDTSVPEIARQITPTRFVRLRVCSNARTRAAPGLARRHVHHVSQSRETCNGLIVGREECQWQCQHRRCTVPCAMVRSHTNLAKHSPVIDCRATSLVSRSFHAVISAKLVSSVQLSSSY